MNKIFTRTGNALLCLLFGSYSQLASAACSDYKGQASINEAGKVGFVEVKLLNAAITSSTYRNWKIDICEVQNKNKTNCYYDLSLSDASVNNSVYLVLDTSVIPSNKAFDILLQDSSNNTIDYLSVGNTDLQDTGCALDFDWSTGISNSHDYIRSPDGSGNWTDNGSGNSGGDSQGDVNEGSDTNNPDISINNVTVMQGESAAFTVSMSSNSSNDVTFDYHTQDNTDKALSYYTDTNASATIPAGDTEATITIATQSLGDNVTRDFSLFIENSTHANITNHLGTATITPAATAVHHYEIIHNDRALTCKAEEITIRACETADCSTLSTQNVTLDFMVDNAKVGDSLTFLGSTTFNLQQLTPGTLTLSLDNTTPLADNDLLCSENDCQIAFNDAGFVFSAISDQVAGVPFSDISIQAIQPGDDGNGGVSCDPNIDFDNATVDIDLSQQNVTPSGTSGLAFLVTGDNTSLGKYPGSTPVTLKFVNSFATISSPNYLDAGEIQLRASFDTGSGGDITGISNNFWVRPDRLELSAQAKDTELNAASVSATPAHNAGGDFTLKVTALNAAGDVTANYSPGQMQLKLTRTGPTGGSNEGQLTYAANKQLTSALSADFKDVTLTGFSSGSSSFDGASYSEVGLINLDVQDSSYGSSSATVSGSDINIGRFIPDHFTLVDNNAEVAGWCGIGASKFTYMDQAQLQVDYLLEARNKAGEVTKNYFDHADPDQDYARAAVALVAENNNSGDGETFPDRLTAFSSSWIEGSYRPANAIAAFSRLGSHADGPFELLQFGLTLADKDGVLLEEPFDMLATESGACTQDEDPLTDCNAIQLSGSAKLLYGRWYIENNFGPETENLPLVMSVQYWNGSNFVTNLDDSCTTYDGETVNNYLFDNTGLNPALAGAPGIEAASGSGTFVNGSNRLLPLMISAPGAGNVGNIYYSYGGGNNITPAWLKYDWDNQDGQLDGPFDDNPKALVSFGQYHGNDRVLYWREIITANN
ncbi:hypothetical protein SG34_017275 [Thalassomonas viridans]|uniref:DUF6701 domain-containing protein n=1 Tax=Thalassomonas viridans TaxID=137584 RepID=A0AAE9YY49_9GAMM|nr:DUF6701 domain-containing protein [Thalassomonas viridans]WDE03160.1 hypothetical protein SG34_017275 [Thalassomonas viridans]